MRKWKEKGDPNEDGRQGIWRPRNEMELKKTERNGKGNAKRMGRENGIHEMYRR